MYPTIVPYFLSSDQSYEKKILPSGAASAYVPAGGASVFFWEVGAEAYSTDTIILSFEDSESHSCVWTTSGTAGPALAIA